jgi:hypothetical protein
MSYTNLLFKAATKPMVARVAVNAVAGATLGGVAGGAYSSHKGEGFGRGFAQGALVGGIGGAAFGFSEKTSLTSMAARKAESEAVAEEITKVNPKPSSTAKVWSETSQERELIKNQKATERIQRAKEKADIASRPPSRNLSVPLEGNASNQLAAETQEHWKHLEIDRQADTRRRAAVFFKSQGKESVSKSLDEEIIAGWDQDLNTFMNQRQAQMPPGAVKIYRGVYDNTEDINPLDWVTTNKTVAEYYSGQGLYLTKGPGSKVLEKIVDGSELRQFPSVHDYFTYTPEGSNWLDNTTGRKLQQGGLKPSFGDQYSVLHKKSVETLAEQGLYGKGILDYPEIHNKYGNPVVEDTPYQNPRPWPRLSADNANTRRLMSEQESRVYVGMDSSEWVPPVTEDAKLAEATADAESAAAIAKRDQYYKDLEDLKNTSSGVTPSVAKVKEIHDMSFEEYKQTPAAQENLLKYRRTYIDQNYQELRNIKNPTPEQEQISVQRRNDIYANKFTDEDWVRLNSLFSRDYYVEMRDAYKAGKTIPADMLERIKRVGDA